MFAILNMYRFFVVLIIGSCLALFLLSTYQNELIRLDETPEKIFILDNSSLSEIDTKQEGEVKRFPQAIIIGAKKCGTRATLEFINIHPMVRVVHPEQNFFSVDEFYIQGYEYYLKKMPRSFPDQITMEKSPKYFKTASAPARIHAFNPRMKIVLVVRDPVTRALSDYVHTDYSKGGKIGKFGNLPPFEEMAIDNSTGQLSESWSPIWIGKYALHFAKWLEYFPRSQILVLSGERLIEDPKPEIEKLEKFLGLEPLIDEEHYVFNETKGFMCYKGFRKDWTKCFSKNKGRQHPDVDPAFLQRLRDFYKPLNEEFYRLAQEDFGWDKM